MISKFLLERMMIKWLGIHGKRHLVRERAYNSLLTEMGIGA